MSRIIDLTKPLKELSTDDLRYAHDRGLLDPDDTLKVGNYLRKLDSEKGGEPADEGGEEFETYEGMTATKLKEEIDRRNAERGEDDQIKPEGRDKASLITALEADDGA